MNISTLLDDTTLSMVMVSVLMSAATIAIVYGLYRERSYVALRKRLDQMADERRPAFAELEDDAGFVERVLRPVGRTLLTRLGRLTPAGNLDQIRKQLVMAGNPRNLAVIDFLGLKMLVAICSAVLVALYLISLGGITAVQIALYSAAGAGLGLYLPNIWLRRRIRQRKEAISRALPDALDMLTTMVDAGLGFDMALVRLCEKWDNPLTHEFDRVVAEMRMGMRKAEALRNLVERVDVPELSTFVAVLIQADLLGISIGRVLHSQSEQIRLRRKQWIEERAAQMPLKMLPVIVLFIFPALFAVILGPAIPDLLSAFSNI